MPFGAHETMEAHEFMTEKINMINHFNLYRQQCQDNTLRQMIERHLDSTIRIYNDTVSYTHDYQVPGINNVSPFQQQLQMNNLNNQIQPEQVRYGLHQPASQQPQLNNTTMNDHQIATAMLSFHKNSAKNSIIQALECVDPNVRQVMLNSAVNCVNEAYEVFQYMNQLGYYQVPTMKNHTAKTMLHSYQPVSQIEVAGHTGFNT